MKFAVICCLLLGATASLNKSSIRSRHRRSLLSKKVTSADSAQAFVSGWTWKRSCYQKFSEDCREVGVGNSGKWNRWGSCKKSSMACAAGCGAGSKQGDEEFVSCVDCGAGRYKNSNTNMGTCVNCAAGQYQGSSGMPSCKSCASGQYAGAGASSCIACVPGKFQASAGKPNCVNCCAGKYSSGSYSSTCSLCEVGKFQDATGKISCKDCAVGKTTVGTGMRVCSDIDECTAGTDTCGDNSLCTNTDGSFTCSCLPGFEMHSGVCVEINDCASNPCQNGGTCEDLHMSFQCTCDANHFGHTCASTHNDCSGDTNVCVHGVCTNTARTTAGQAAYTCDCSNAGYKKAPGGIHCTVDKNECQEEEGQPKACGLGHSCQNTLGSFTCTECQAGYQGQGHNCNQCMPGTFSEKGSSTCEPCPAGTRSGAGASHCTGCEAGRFSAAGSCSCSACGQGRSTNGQTGQASCTACAAGKYAEAEGQAQCDDIPENRGASDIGGTGEDTGATVMPPQELLHHTRKNKKQHKHAK